MPDTPILSCMRILPGIATVEGVTPGNCSNCKAGVWLSPSSRALMAKMELRVLCNECSSDWLTANVNMAGFALAPGALQEYARYRKNPQNN